MLFQKIVTSWKNYNNIMCRLFKYAHQPFFILKISKRIVTNKVKYVAQYCHIERKF